MAESPKLAPFSSLTSIENVMSTLSTLFEPSPALLSKLAPAVHNSLEHIDSYECLIDYAIQTMRSWPSEDQASFISGHPRIGEVRGLSALSTAEQAKHATSPEVLARLAELNALYERVFPGLRYITFVNGRTRKVIMEEMEEKLMSDGTEKAPVAENSEEWEVELGRAVEDVGRIAKSRLKVLL